VSGHVWKGCAEVGRPDPDEVYAFWHDVLEDAGLPEDPVEEGHEDDVYLEDLDIEHVVQLSED